MLTEMNRQRLENNNLKTKRSSHVRQLGDFYFQKSLKPIVVRPTLSLSSSPRLSFPCLTDRLKEGEVGRGLFRCF